MFFVIAMSISASAHDWYTDLKQPNGASCCNSSAHAHNGDCGPTQARWNGSNWEAFSEGRWVVIDPSRVLDVQSPDGKAHYCGKSGVTYCFIKPEPEV